MRALRHRLVRLEAIVGATGPRIGLVELPGELLAGWLASSWGLAGANPVAAAEVENRIAGFDVVLITPVELEAAAWVEAFAA